MDTLDTSLPEDITAPAVSPPPPAAPAASIFSSKDPYAGVLAEHVQRQQKVDTVNRSLAAAITRDPVEYAKYKRMSGLMGGMDPALILENADLKAEAARRAKTINVDSLIDTSPATVAWLAQSPENAVVAQNDVGALGHLEALAKSIWSAIPSGRRSWRDLSPLQRQEEFAKGRQASYDMLHPENNASNGGIYENVNTGRQEANASLWFAAQDMATAAGRLPTAVSATWDAARTLFGSPSDVISRPGMDEQQRYEKATQGRMLNKYGIGFTSDTPMSIVSSIPFSVFAMAGGLAGFAAGAAIPVPGAAYVGGMAGAGWIGGALDRGMVWRQLYEMKSAEYKAKYQRDITPSEFNTFVAQPEIEDQVRKHYLFEAGTEAAGNLIFSGTLLKSLLAVGGNVVGAVVKAEGKGALSIAKAAVADQAGEQATETITQVGQNQAEAALQLQSAPPPQWSSIADWRSAYSEIVYPTLGLGLVLGGGAKIISKPLAMLDDYRLGNKIDEFVTKGGHTIATPEQIDTVVAKAEALALRHPDNASLLKNIETLTGFSDAQRLFIGALAPGVATLNATDGVGKLNGLIETAAGTQMAGHSPDELGAFLQTVGGSVYIDPEGLQDAFAQAGEDLAAVLPTAAEQLADGVPGAGPGVEVPVAELVKGLLNSKARNAVLQHVRMDADSVTLAEAKAQDTTKMEAFFQESLKKIQDERATDKVFLAEIQQIQDDVAYGLDSVGTYTPTANKAQAKAIGAFYAVLADKVGVTPLQLRDGWTDAAGVAHKGVRFHSMGAPMQGFNHGQAMLNVGLDVGATDRTQKIDADFVKAEIEKLGVRVLTGRNVPGKYMLNGKMVDELTYVPRLSRPLTDAEVLQLAAATGQEAIAQYHKGVGTLHGTPENLANWGKFNPEFFKDQMGGTLLGEQAAFDAQQGGLDQAVSTRTPSAKKGRPDPHMTTGLDVDYEVAKTEPTFIEKLAAIVKQYPGAKKGLRKAESIVEADIEMQKNNLLWLYDLVPLEVRERSRLWYVGGRKIVDRWQAKYEGRYSAPQIAAVLAAMSPTMPWDNNVTLGERIIDIFDTKQDHVWDDKMEATALRILQSEEGQQQHIDMRGKSLRELDAPLMKAVWIRVYDETHNPRAFRQVTPEGGFGPNMTTLSGAETTAGWLNGHGPIANAVSALMDGSMPNISRALGDRHKVRNFYNNLFDPSDPRSVTIDTHAVSAARLRPLAGESLEALQNFGANVSNAPTGMKGTYVLGAEAYRRAAAERGVLPRELQSITWEALRRLFTPQFKSKMSKNSALMAEFDAAWSDYAKGKATLDETHARILELAGGKLADPAWVGLDSGLAVGAPASSYQGGVLERGWADGAAGRGNGSSAAAGISDRQLYQDSPAVRAGAVSGPVVGVHYSQQDRTALSSSAFGQGMKGAERDRIAASTDPRLKQRIAFYVNTGAGIKPESGVGSHAHTATLTNLYDADADVLKLWRNNRGDLNASESAVLDAGFDGYLKRDGLGAAVLLGPRRQAVEPVAGTDVPVVPSPQIPAAKAAAIALATNTSLINGRQTAAEWKKDLTRLDPDMAAKVEWEKLDQEKLFYRQDLADTLWQGREQWYFSALENALKAAPAKVFGSGKAVAQWLRSNAGKMGVKSAEIEATGITDWLEMQDKVTKDQVAAFMAQGGVRTREVMLGEIPIVSDRDIQPGEEFYGYKIGVNENGDYTATNEYGDVVHSSYTREGIADFINDATENAPKAKYADSDYVLPGGQDHFELVLTIPSITPWGERDTAHYGPESGGRAVVWVRGNTRVDANGKRVLFIEEIQSKRAQAGRKEGFGGFEVVEPSGQLFGRYSSQADAEAALKRAKAGATMTRVSDMGVPSAPFVTDTKTWTALALKRMIAYAVDNGFDSVAWTTGEQQAERYDLSKQVDHIVIDKVFSNETQGYKYLISAYKTADSMAPILEQEAGTPAEIADVIGKDAADKVLKDMGAGTHGELNNADLKVGGEGMKGYYDGIVPQVANDVLKKIGGGTVGEVELQTGGAAQALLGESSQQPGFDITPAMREIVSTKGLPLFAGTPKKGSFSPANMDMRLLADADLSTFLHETSHWFLAAYTQLASEPGAPQALVDEVNALLGHLFSTVQGGAVAGGDLAQQSRSAITPDDIVSNPTPARLVAMLRKSRGESLRYVVGKDGAFHFWDAYIAVHKDGADAAGVPYDYTRRGTVYSTPDGLASFTWDIGLHVDDLRKYMVGDHILFSAAGHGVVTGAEMAKILDAESDTLLRDLLAQNGPVPAPTPLPAGATPLEQWNNMTLDQQRPYHEAWAESGEQYFMTGKAPSLALDSVFRTFANWLKRIYGSLKEFVAGHTGGKIHPTTAAFFDRMLATEAEIQQANEARGYVQLFKDAAEAGMTENAWAAYQAMGDEQREDAEAMLRARSLRDMKWLQNARTKIIGAMQKEAAEQRKAVREQVATELASTPLRLAAKWLKKGEMTQADGTELKVTEGHKLSKSGIEEIFPEGALTPRPDLSALRGMTAKEGLAPDLVAELANEQMGGNFTSGEDLVRQLLEMKPFKEEVEELTDLRMLQEHSEMIDQAAIERAADEAITNDAHIRMVATELAALAKGIGSPAQLTKAAKEYARQLIETKTSKTLKPWSFAAAATRARKAAMTALRKGERDEAQKQSRLDLLNTVATKMSYETEADVKKIIDRFKRIVAYSDKHSSVKSRDFATVQAVRALISQIGIGTKGEKATEYLKLVAAYDPATSLLLSNAIDTFGEKGAWQDIKIGDLRELSENVNALWRRAKDTRAFKIGEQRLQMEDVAKELVEVLRPFFPKDNIGSAHAVTEDEKNILAISGIKSVVARMEIWADRVDGVQGVGPTARYLVNVIKTAENNFMEQRETELKLLNTRLKAIAPLLKPRLIDAYELGEGYVFGRGPGRSGMAELIAALQHTGNPSNKGRLLLAPRKVIRKDGTEVESRWGAKRQDGTLDTTQWDAFIKRMEDSGVITKEVWDFVQGTWDTFERLKPQMQAAHMDVFGKLFAEITTEKFTTRFGEYAGGYVPALTDRDIVHDHDVRNLDLEALGGISLSLPMPESGMTKERAANYAQPLALDLGLLGMQLNKALLFAHMAQPVSQVQRLVNTTEVKGALDKAFPGARKHMIMPWLGRAAAHRVSMSSPEFGATGQAWNFFRASTGMSRMMGNVSNAAQQYTGIATAAGMLESKKQLIYAAPALLWIGDLRARVREMSTYMRQRMDAETSAVAANTKEILVNPSVFQSVRRWTFQHGYFLQQWADMHATPVVWMAAYNSIKEAHPATTEQDARDYADHVVRVSQGASGPTDISTFEAGHPFTQIFTQFSGWGLGQGHAIYSEMAKNFRRDVGLSEKYAKATGIVLLMTLVAPMLAEAIALAFRGGPDDEDDDGVLIDDWLHQIMIMGPAKFAMGTVPVLGKVGNLLLARTTNTPMDDRLSMAPIVSTVEGAARAPFSIYAAMFKDGKPSRAIKDAAEIGTLFGMPLAPIARPVGYLADVSAGRVAPTGPVDAVRGTITGTASPTSKQ